MFTARSTARLGEAVRRRRPAAHQLQSLGLQAACTVAPEFGARCRGAAQGALAHLATMPSQPTDQPRPPVCSPTLSRRRRPHAHLAQPPGGGLRGQGQLWQARPAARLLRELAGGLGNIGCGVEPAKLSLGLIACQARALLMPPLPLRRIPSSASEPSCTSTTGLPHTLT